MTSTGLVYPTAGFGGVELLDLPYIMMLTMDGWVYSFTFTGGEQRTHGEHYDCIDVESRQ